MKKIFTRIKHPFCGISHWLGAILAVIGTIALLVMAHGDPVKSIAFAIYGFTLIVLYVASSLYHSVRVEGKPELILRKLDHVGIFLLIAGTYVPVCLLALKPTAGWILLSLQATCAVIGILGTFVLRKFPEVLNVVLYLVMGWMAVPLLGYMLGHWPAYATGWLVSGGLVYTAGQSFFPWTSPISSPENLARTICGTYSY